MAKPKRLQDRKACQECTLYSEHYIPPFIQKHATVLFVGKKPEREDVKAQRPFSSESLDGPILQSALDELTVPYALTNVIHCRTPNDRDPSQHEINCCHGLLEQDFETVSPDLIVALGATALMCLTGEKGVEKNNGKVWFDYPTPIAVSVHPASVYNHGEY